MHAFFTSYAYADGQKEFRHCLGRLRELVGNKTGWAEESLCFFDTETLKNGDPWQPVLAEAVRTSRVAVCFVSLRYLQSIWCGREFTVFDQRRSAWNAVAGGVAGDGRFIFLLVWESAVGWEWPLPLRYYQYRDATLPKEYLAGGLRKLVSLFPQIAESVLESLSDAIRDAVLHPAPLPDAPPIVAFEEVPNVLAIDPKPYDFWLSVVAKQGSNWVPPGAIDDVGTLVFKRAGLSNVTARLLPLDASCGPRAAQAAAEKQLVILVAASEAAAADLRLAALNKASIPHLVIVVLDTGPATGQNPLSLDAWVARFPAGAFALAAAEGRARVALPTELVMTLDGLVTRVLQQVRAQDEPKPAASAAIEAKATEEGIPVTTRSVLAGPGEGGSR
ncbi:MAG: toll/interleukin-1 receptor domain-containing protein [Verrucomicrobiales bacterium]|nr:toll/interleukin-1 receptor domain-containing protein [Verrucomicrobiales bacterium]